MKLLLVSYFFPPVQNVAAERWHRYSSYLQSLGHEIEVWTGPWDQLPSSQMDAEKLKFLEVQWMGDPLSADARSILNHDKTPEVTSRSQSQKANHFFRILLLDGKWWWSIKVFWRLLDRLRAPHPCQDWVLVTGTPWSALPLVTLACRLRRQRYAVDFRDSWSEDFKVQKSRFHLWYARRLEAWVLKHASLGITINRFIGDHLRMLNPQIPVVEVAHGFKQPLIQSTDAFNAIRSNEILYAGSISNYHGLDSFLNIVPAELRDHLHFMGTDHGDVLRPYGLIAKPYLSEDQALEHMKLASVLLMTLSEEQKGFTTGKLMTYIQAERPILYYGPAQSPAAQIIKENRIGWIIQNGDKKALQEVLAEIAGHTREKKPFSFNPDWESIKSHSVAQYGERLNAALKAPQK